MTLKEKFNNELGYDKGVIIPEKLEQIADDYAIEFAEWCNENNSGLINKELLEIYKEEKGL